MSRKILQPSLLVLALLTALTATLSFAAEQNSAKASKPKGDTMFSPNQKEPIVITSDRMEADRKQNTIVYSGRVVAVQGDMTMKSDVLTARYNIEMKQMKDVVAEGRVHITQGDRVATGSKAIFNGAEKSIVLTGSPIVRQGDSEITGSRITFYMEKELAVAEGGPQRVKAVIYPDQLQTKEQKDAERQK